MISLSAGQVVFWIRTYLSWCGIHPTKLFCFLIVKFFWLDWVDNNSLGIKLSSNSVSWSRWVCSFWRDRAEELAKEAKVAWIFARIWFFSHDGCGPWMASSPQSWFNVSSLLSCVWARFVWISSIVFFLRLISARSASLWRFLELAQLRLDSFGWA